MSEILKYPSQYTHTHKPDRLTNDRLITYLTAWDRLTDWLIDWQTDGLIDWQTYLKLWHWLTDRLTNLHTNELLVKVISLTDCRTRTAKHVGWGERHQCLIHAVSMLLQHGYDYSHFINCHHHHHKCPSLYKPADTETNLHTNSVLKLQHRLTD